MTTMETQRSTPKPAGALSTRSMIESLAIHLAAVLLMLFVASQTVLRSAPVEKPVDIVFYRPPEIAIPVPAVKLAMPRTAYPDAAGLGAPAPAVSTYWKQMVTHLMATNWRCVTEAAA